MQGSAVLSEMAAAFKDELSNLRREPTNVMNVLGTDRFRYWTSCHILRFSFGAGPQILITRGVGGSPLPFLDDVIFHSAVNELKCRPVRICDRRDVAAFGEGRRATNRDMFLSSTLTLFPRACSAWLLTPRVPIGFTELEVWDGGMPRQDGSLKA